MKTQIKQRLALEFPLYFLNPSLEINHLNVWYQLLRSAFFYFSVIDNQKKRKNFCFRM